MLLDVPIPFPLKNADVCKDSNSGITCPLKGDQEAEYKSTFAIDKATPSVRTFYFRVDFVSIRPGDFERVRLPLYEMLLNLLHRISKEIMT